MSPDIESSPPDVNTPLLPRARPKGRVLSVIIFSLFLALLLLTFSSCHCCRVPQWYWLFMDSSFLLANAASTPIWGKLSDIWGRKLLLLVAVVTFLVGSLLCAVAVDMGMFISGRAIQGSGSGGIIILVQICITDLFDIRNRGLFLGLTSVIWALASGIGPVLGGALTQLASWRWNWWINLPTGLSAFVILVWLLEIDSNRTSFQSGFRNIDWLGSVSIVASALLILLELNLGGVHYAWGSPKIIALVVLGAAMLVVFILNEAWLAKHPIIPLRLFNNRSNVAALSVCFCHGFTYISAPYFLPLYFQAVKGSSALMSGILILPIALTQCFSGIATGVFIKHTGRYIYPILTGTTLMTIGFGLFTLIDEHMPILTITLIELIAGIGVGMNFQSPLIALQSSIPQPDFATATATFGFTRNIATSVSVVVGGVIFQNGIQAAYLTRVLGKELAVHFSGSNAQSSVSLIAGLSEEQRRVVRLAYLASLERMWVMYVWVAVVGLVVSLTVRRRVLPVVQGCYDP